MDYYVRQTRSRDECQNTRLVMRAAAELSARTERPVPGPGNAFAALEEQAIRLSRSVSSQATITGSPFHAVITSGLLRARRDFITVVGNTVTTCGLIVTEPPAGGLERQQGTRLTPLASL